MTRHRRSIKRDFARASALALAAWACAAAAQTSGSVNDFQLPAGPTRAAPPVEGPTDPDNPVVRPRAPAPTPNPSPAPAATPAPQITLPATSATVSPRRAAPELAAPRATAAPVPVETLAPAPTASAFAEPAPTSSASILPAALPEATEGRGDVPWPWIAGGALALVLLIGVAIAWRRRRTPEPDTYQPTAPNTAPEPSAPAALPSRPVQPPARPAQATPEPLRTEPTRVTAGALELAFEARHYSQAMVNASIAYRIALTNTGDAPLGPLSVAGDMTSAHGSLSAERLLARDGEALTPMHEIPALAPGETREFKGELRLPLAAILPIHQAGARLFVPLARLRISGEALDLARVFVVGQSGQAGGALRPFALDRGPGMVRDIGQREVFVTT